MKKPFTISPKFRIFFAFGLFLLANCSLLIDNCLSQSITWNRTYNYYPYNQNDYANCSCIATDGNFIIAGTGGNAVIWVIKINQLGDTIWTCSPPGWIAYALTATNDGGCVLTGYGDSSTAFVIKLNANGITQWNKSYGGSDVRLYSIIKTIDGGYIACGNDWRTNKDGLILKIDALGNLIWMKYFLAGYDKTLYSIMETSDGKLLVTGDDMPTYGGGNPSKTLVMKLNELGDSIWIKRFNINSASSVGKRISISHNNYIIGGITGDTLHTEQNCPFILKLDTSGNILNTSTYFLAPNEYYLSFGLSDNRYLFTTTIIYAINHLSGKVYLIDTSGTLLRQKEFNDTGQVELRSILSLPGGDLIFAGYYGNYGPTRNDFFVVRTDSILNFPPVGILKQSNSVPINYILYQNYPNPFNPVTKIKYEINIESYVSLEVFDILGKKVTTLIDKKLRAGTYLLDIDCSDFSSGIYFCSLYSNNSLINSIKMIYMK